MTEQSAWRVWTLAVKSGDESDRVSFEVQVAEARSTRKGFSFAQ